MQQIEESDARLAIAKFFDYDWYLSQNADVISDGIDPVLHYLRHGAREGRRPRPDFDGAAYLAANPDVAAGGMNPFLHWILLGGAAGHPVESIKTLSHHLSELKISGQPTHIFQNHDHSARNFESPEEFNNKKIIKNFFDRAWYILQNPDVAENDLDPVIHYLRHGASEGRWPRADFDGNGYLAANPDVAAAGINPLVHWVLNGRKEGRRRGGDNGENGLPPDINEILPTCLQTTDWIEEKYGQERIREVFQELEVDTAIYGISVGRVSFPIVLYAADQSSIPSCRIRQALALTTGKVFVLDTNHSHHEDLENREHVLLSDSGSALKKLLQEITKTQTEFVGFWEISLTPSISAWPLLQDSLNRNPNLVHIGGSIVRSNGQLWRSGHVLGHHDPVLRPQGSGEHFLHPRQFRLKPSAAIEPLFGIFRTHHLIHSLEIAFNKPDLRTANVLENLSSIEDSKNGIGAANWATQGCALAMTDAIPPISPSAKLANLATNVRETTREGIVFVDSIPPRPDQDAGSVTATNILDILLSRGSEVLFFSTTLRSWSDPYVLSLAARGIICLTDALIPNYDVACDFIRKGNYSPLIFFLTRIYAGGEYVETTRARFPRARLIFNTVDLHGMRELREAKRSKSGSSIFSAHATNAREHDIIRRCDATILLSEAELAELEPTLGYANLHVIPLVAEFSPPKNDFSRRCDLMFIGGFAHEPNIDAVEYIIEDLWAPIRRRMPSICLTIVGPHFPDRLRSRLPEGVTAVGFVADLSSALENVRITIAPLRYGAGIKGKIATSLSHGVPCVTTTLGAEGMGTTHGEELLIADDPHTFATAVCRLYEDEELWRQMSNNGYRFSESRFSIDAVAHKINSMLDMVVG